MEAQRVSLNHDSAVWFFLKQHQDNLPIYVKKDHDGVVFNVSWFLEDLENMQTTRMEDRDKYWENNFKLFTAFAQALDKEPECEDWRKLYFFEIFP